METIVILGGSGFIGKNLCEYLVKRGYEVISISHQIPDCNMGYAYKEIGFDLMGGEDIFLLLRQIDACDVCILLSWIGTRERDRLDVNLESANRLLTVFKAFAKKFPMAMYIQAGSAAEYGMHDYETVTEDSVCNPFSPYGKGKLFFYKYASDYSHVNKINFIELRFHSVFGITNDKKKILVNVISSFARGEHVTMKSDCSQLWNYISVYDVCHLIHMIIQKGRLQSDTYNVGCNDAKPLRQYLMQLTELCSVDPSMISFGDEKDTMSYNFVFDSSRIQNELNWNPANDFGEVVRLMKTNLL